MAADRVVCLLRRGRTAPGSAVGGSSFLPRTDVGMVAIDVRTPSSASLEYARSSKVEKAAELSA